MSLLNKSIKDINMEIKKLENKTEYYKDGKLHREDEPTLEYPWEDGYLVW
jgi:hypothetical protein